MSDYSEDELPQSFANKPRMGADEFLRRGALGSATYKKLDTLACDDIARWISSDAPGYWEDRLPQRDPPVSFVQCGNEDNYVMRWDDQVDSFGGAERGA